LKIGRKVALNRSNDDFPINWILIQGDGRLIGHAATAKQPNPNVSSSIIFISSVVIDGSLRGSGLGRLLMQKLESELRHMTFRRLELCTINKESFYSRLGYQTVKRDLNFLNESKPEVTIESKQSISLDRFALQSNHTNEPLHCNTPPPPPLPPPRPVTMITAQCIQPKVWMVKLL
jgi:N-acetylglutamate synthase-like GNAT family acetyltransferase